MAAFMDELVIDPISGEQITPRHAVLIPQIPGITDILEYLKSVASTVGPSNIRSAYRVGDNVKIYFRFLKHVDEVINTGVLVRGQYTEVNYSIPPATEVFLKNVDTEIPNLALSKHLEFYGNLMSKINTKRIIVEGAEFGHVESNVRRVFMKLDSGIALPPSFTVNHCMNDYVIEVSLANEELSTSFALPEKADSLVSVDKSSSHASNVEKKDLVKASNKFNDCSVILDNPHIQAVQPRQRLATAIRSRGFRGRGRVTRGRRGFGRNNYTLVTKVKKAIKRGGRGSRLANRLMSRRKKTVVKEPDSIDQLPEVDGTGEEVMDAVNCAITEVTSSKASSVVSNEEMSSKKTKFLLENSDLGFVVKGVYSRNESVQFDVGTTPANQEECGITPYPFTLAKLEEFLREVKNNRNPTEFAACMLEANNTSGALTELCNQLLEYSNITKDYALKLRVNRLVQILSDAR